MFPPISNLLSEYGQLSKFLSESNEISLLSDVNNHFRKIFLLSCASYYEIQITETIKVFIGANSNDDRILEFAKSKGIERQYHTYFDWKNPRNVNSFLRLFGNDFKESTFKEIDGDPTLQEQSRAFLIIGGERNKMVHENFLSYTLEMSFDELISLSEKANKFVEYICSKFKVE